MLTEKQLKARQALIDAMAAVSIQNPQQMADLVLDGLEDRGYKIIKTQWAKN
jgi:hypothetical protein